MSRKKKLKKQADDAISVEEIEQNIHSVCDECIKNIKNDKKSFENCHKAEKSITGMVAEIGRLFFQLYLMSFQEKFDLSKWMNSGKFKKKKISSKGL